MSRRCADDRGYAMAALLAGMSVMAILMSVAMPTWRSAVQREREAELIFRGEQYAHAIELYSRRNGGFPPSLDVLEKGRFIRKLYKDPMTTRGDFQPVYLGQVLPGQTTAPTQPGRGVPGRGAPGAPTGRADQTPVVGGRATPAAGQFPGARGGQPTGAVRGQSGPIGAGPIIGVISKSTAESLRLYNGRGHYNEWAFVAIAATTQPGVPGGGRGVGQDVPGRGNPRGAGQRRGEPPPARGRAGRGGPAPGRGTPFGLPGGFPPSGSQQAGRGAPRP